MVSWQIDDPELEQSITAMMLIFEMYQPDIGYVPGMEKIALFLRKIMEESTAFIIFFNVIFASPFMWSIYKQDHQKVFFFKKR